MTPAQVGIAWSLAFVFLESIQFVFFGNVFQRVSSVLFGSIVLGITTVAFVGWAAIRRRDQLRLALSLPRHLIAINLTATASWLMFLMAVQLIEPAIAYTLGAGAMPLAAWVAHRLGVAEGDAPRNRTEATGVLIILVGMIYLSIITITGASGFVRGGTPMAVLGITLALAEGTLFTWLLFYCARIDRKGVGPGTVFGLRFPLYIITAAILASQGFDAKASVPTSELTIIVAIGLMLIIPPLLALQFAVALVSTLTISIMTALGPFVIFMLQVAEGRVTYSTPTLIGLGVYFAGAVLAAFGAVRASSPAKQAVP